MASESKDAMETELADSEAADSAQPQAEAPGATIKSALVISLADVVCIAANDLAVPEAALSH